MKQGVDSTVIGSYPVDINRNRLIHDYFNGVMPSFKPVVKKAVSEMVSAGITLVSDGQTRDPFIHIFARGLKGCRIRKRAEVISTVEHTHPITLNDLAFVRSFLPKHVRLLGLLVGPHTLSESVDNQFYEDKKQLAFDIAAALNKEACAIQSVVDMISIDEPFFVNSYPEYTMDLIKEVRVNVDCPIRLHACGDISDHVSDFVDLPVDVLSHEFAASPQLFDVFKEYESKKNICLGSVRSDQVRVESVKQIIDHVSIAKEVFGDQIIQIAPDCGLRLLPESVAFKKLQHIEQARELIYGKK